MGREGHSGRRDREGGPAATAPSPRASTAAPCSALWAGSLKACSAASPPPVAGEGCTPPAQDPGAGDRAQRAQRALAAGVNGDATRAMLPVTRGSMDPSVHSVHAETLRMRPTGEWGPELARDTPTLPLRAGPGTPNTRPLGSLGGTPTPGAAPGSPHCPCPQPGSLPACSQQAGAQGPAGRQAPWVPAGRQGLDGLLLWPASALATPNS